jgi:16S rRNA processing protein RimM
LSPGHRRLTQRDDERRGGSPQRVALGYVVAAHGLHGAVRVRILGDAPDNLMCAPAVMLGASETDPTAETFEVVAVEPGKPGEVRLTLAGVDDRDRARELRGRLVMVEAAEIQPLPDGEYYQYEFIGCQVEGEDGQLIGTVREVWSTGAPDVLVVEGASGDRHLIPIGGDFLKEVDVARRRIVVELIPGLLDGI